MIFVSTTNDGGEIRYRDGKRYLWLLSVVSPSLPGIGAILLMATGNPLWVFFALGIYYGLIPLLDLAIGEDPFNPPEAVVDQLSGDRWYRTLLFLTIPVYYASLILSVIAAGTMELPLWAFLGLAFSAAASSGPGLVVGHELGHKPGAADQLGAKLVNAISGYGHFCIEHNRGHHVMVATPEDPASARYGESLYAFAAREIPGALRRGLALETARLAKKGLPFWTLRNDLLQGYAINLAMVAAATAAFGWTMLPFFLVHNLAAWFHLTMANYVEHYGLLRRRLANGRYEPCLPRHSWNTNHIVSNLMLFHLQRHSDHHANPTRPYQALRNFDDLPRLPSGYSGSFVLALIPPLWFRVMNPKALAWAGGDVTKLNRGPRQAG